jgi:hypothetical protein
MADDEDIAALVIDNGSGMCKGASFEFALFAWQDYSYSDADFWGATVIILGFPHHRRTSEDHAPPFEPR